MAHDDYYDLAWVGAGTAAQKEEVVDSLVDRLPLASGTDASCSCHCEVTCRQGTDVEIVSVHLREEEAVVGIVVPWYHLEFGHTVASTAVAVEGKTFEILSRFFETTS